MPLRLSGHTSPGSNKLKRPLLLRSSSDSAVFFVPFNYAALRRIRETLLIRKLSRHSYSYFSWSAFPSSFCSIFSFYSLSLFSYFSLILESFVSVTLIHKSSNSYSSFSFTSTFLFLYLTFFFFSFFFSSVYCFMCLSLIIKMLAAKLLSVHKFLCSYRLASVLHHRFLFLFLHHFSSYGLLYYVPFLFNSIIICTSLYIHLLNLSLLPPSLCSCSAFRFCSVFCLSSRERWKTLIIVNILS